MERHTSNNLNLRHSHNIITLRQNQHHGPVPNGLRHRPFDLNRRLAVLLLGDGHGVAGRGLRDFEDIVRAGVDEAPGACEAEEGGSCEGERGSEHSGCFEGSQVKAAEGQ